VRQSFAAFSTECDAEGKVLSVVLFTPFSKASEDWRRLKASLVVCWQTIRSFPGHLQ